MKSVSLLLLSIILAASAPAVWALPDEPVAPDETEASPDAHLSAPAREVVKLADANTDTNVIASYIQNSTQPFQLNAADVIYLRDVGIDTNLINAMLNHDVQVSAGVTNRFTEPVAVAPDTNTAVVAQTAPFVPPENISEDVQPFYDALSPYGSWIYISGQGWAWQPNAVVTDPGWQPYSDAGRWLWSDCGWYWSSDYSWGWAPFHYGRWWRSPSWRWVWFPDRHWGPSWVTWRTYGDYCGWAPLPPHTQFVGSGFSFNNGFVGLNFDFGLSSDCFTFVGFPFFQRHDFRHHRLPHDRVNNFFRHSTVVNNFSTTRNNIVVNNGVSVDRVRRATREPFATVPVVDRPRTRATLNQPTERTRAGRTVAVTRTTLPTTTTPTTSTTTAPGQSFSAQQVPNTQTPITPSVPRRLSSPRLSETGQLPTQPRVNPVAPSPTQGRTVLPEERRLWNGRSTEQSLVVPSQKTTQGELPARPASPDIREPSGAKRVDTPAPEARPARPERTREVPSRSRNLVPDIPRLTPSNPPREPAPTQQITPQTQVPRSSEIAVPPARAIAPPNTGIPLSSRPTIHAPAMPAPRTVPAPSIHSTPSFSQGRAFQSQNPPPGRSSSPSAWGAARGNSGKDHKK